MRRIVEFDMKGNARAVYGSLLEAEAGSGVSAVAIDKCLSGAWPHSGGRNPKKFSYEVTKEDLRRKKLEGK